mmetsp:Transcript_13856/g.35359  ORF Transcript_13856/g.35359 Transcript_13856/m.35359 type:complete len:188 (-) Transcript_13856:245-808(-)
MFLRVRWVLATAAASAGAVGHHLWTSVDTPGTTKDVAAVAVVKGDGVQGVVRFTQKGNSPVTKIQVEVSGLKQGLHGCHIHEFGDLSNGCVTAGPHFNPYNMEHGGPQSQIRHVGDLGNIVADSSGKATVELDDRWVMLSGTNSVIGRSVVIHADPDDLGEGGFPDSKTTGHAGARVACGVIGLANA